MNFLNRYRDLRKRSSRFCERRRVPRTLILWTRWDQKVFQNLCRVESYIAIRCQKCNGSHMIQLRDTILLALVATSSIGPLPSCLKSRGYFFVVVPWESSFWRRGPRLFYINILHTVLTCRCRLSIPSLAILQISK